MPCSCGNTSCPCGIPCYCSEELCKCSDCAIALPSFCKVCNKLLITDIRADGKTCFCFIGDSKALIHDNHDNPQRRSGNLPIPTSYFLSGKLVVNAMIPISVMRFPHFVPKQLCSMPALPSVSNHSKVSLVSDMEKVKTLHPLENSPFPTTESHKFLKKSNETGDYDLNRTGFNCQQNPGKLYKFCNPPGVLKTKETIQAANTAQSTKYETESNSNLSKTIFYLPSVIIDDISFPVEMMDPIWRLSTPDGCMAGSSNSTFNLINPFYMSEPLSTTATFNSDLSQSAPYPSSEINDRQCFSNNQNGNTLPESFISSPINGKILDPSILLEKTKFTNYNQHGTATVLSNNANGVKFSTHPENGYPIESSEQFRISGKLSYTGKSEQFGVSSTSESRQNSSKYASPEICNTENMISSNVVQESSGEMWQNVPLSEIPEFINSNPPNLNESSKLQKFFDPNSQNYENSQRGPSEFASAEDNRNEENILLYVDSNTNQKIERYLNF